MMLLEKPEHSTATLKIHELETGKFYVNDGNLFYSSIIGMNRWGKDGKRHSIGNHRPSFMFPKDGYVLAEGILKLEEGVL